MNKLNKKHLRTALIIFVVVAVLAAFVALVAIPSMKRAAIEKAKEELFQNMYSFPESGIITAENGYDNLKKNSLIYVKAALQSDVDCVEVDVCFDEEGVPYVAESADKIDENTMPLEYLISFFHEETSNSGSRRHHLNLHLTDAANLKEVGRIVESYEMTDYCFLTGINVNQAKFVRTSCNVNFYIDYEIDKNRVNDPEYHSMILSDLGRTGAIGINCKIDNFTHELSVMLKENWYKISFYDVEDELDIIKAISFYPNQIITSNPEYARLILIEWNAKAPSSDIIFS
ncbi:MAG: hypothetical protein E7536_10160 [Ruminococcaceae bacterium]|nr:hypothetical protein [Oscillospiraceae bacterium]